jgi:hypothetical protein
MRVCVSCAHSLNGPFTFAIADYLLSVGRRQKELDHETDLRSGGRSGFHRRLDTGVGCQRTWRHAWQRAWHTWRKSGAAAARA